MNASEISHTCFQLCAALTASLLLQLELFFSQQLEATQQLFIAYFSLSRLSRQDTIAKRREDERSVTLRGANEEDRLGAASATSHQIGGIKRRNPFADGR